ncbi:MAG: hypothetical protein A2Y02_02020 [Omnitrophica bacterium GWA2_52_12]|nr:MAG: hypothetical protein A2Y02_02020 [Omnitrophica bacterium GWA2_52_12]
MLAFFLPSCSIKTGPDLLVPISEVKDRAPVLRVGEVTEALTGSWTQDPGIGTAVFRNYLIDAFKEPAVASRFSPSSSNLTMNIDLVSDHESDQPRLGNLGGLSMLTLGIIPLNYFSAWDVDCKVNILSPAGETVADYVFQERGTYRIWAFPLTMLTLSGAGIRGDQDARAMFRKVAASLAAKIAEAVDNDYEKLAARVKKPELPQEVEREHAVETPKPLIV